MGIGPATMFCENRLVFIHDQLVPLVSMLRHSWLSAAAARTAKTSAEKPLALLFILLVASSAFADSSSVTERTVTKIADGIYEIRHRDAPNFFPQGNTTVIVGDRDVLVVDACYLPSSAREDIAQIGQWTDKPVRYLVNTHWHADHTRGNGAYAEAFPSINIISQTATRELIQGNYADHPANAAMIVHRDDDRTQRCRDLPKDACGRKER